MLFAGIRRGAGRMLELSIGMAVLSILCLACLCLIACAPHTSSPGSRSGTSALTDAEESAIGMSADQLLRKSPGLYAGNTDLGAYVRSIGAKIAAHSKRPPEATTFAIVDSADLNAFALPGGYVYVTRGLLGWLNSEDELAAVLAHEVAHVSERHGLGRLPPMEETNPARTGGEGPSETSPAAPPAPGQDTRGQAALHLALESRTVEEEREADMVAQKILRAAGYGSGAMDDLAATIARAQAVAPRRLRPWLTSHAASSEDRAGTPSGSSPQPGSTPPDPTERSSGAGGSGVPESGASGSTPDSRREAYVAKLEGLSAGQGNAASWVNGDLYVNTRHDFSLRIPPGWTPELRGPDLVLHGPGGRDRAEMIVETLARPGVSAEVARGYARSAAREGLEAAGPLTKATLPAGEAALLPLRSTDASGEPVLIRKMFLVRFDRAYMLSFRIPADKVEETDQTFMKLTGSIVFLSPDRLESLQAPRIALYRVRDGDSWDSLASRYAVRASGRGGASGGAGQAGGAVPQASDAAGGEGAHALAAFNGQDAREPLRAGLLLKVPPAAALE